MNKQWGYWTKEKCQEEALNYSIKKDFQDSSGSAYNKAFNMKWLDDICVHMKQNRHWTFSSCQQEALKYTTKVDFKEKSGSAYVKSCANKWIDEICQHMVVTGNLKKRCIYAIEFNDNHVYVGLTYSFNKRMKRHLIDENSSVNKYIKESNIIPEFKQITNYININDAIVKEGYYVNYYKINGWNILNQTKTGTIGGNVLKWTKKKCTEDALEYKTKHEYFKKSSNSYQAAKRYGWFDEVCQHMVSKYGAWTKEKCQNEALKYKTKTEFRKKSSGAHIASYRNGWLNEICSHMIKIKY